MSDITQQQFGQMLTGADIAQRVAHWLEPMIAALRACAIDSAQRQAAFLAQVLVESGELRHKEEALNYSPERLQQVWPQRFPNADIAARYGHQPQALANHVYAGRMGNGDEASGDGWRYRGRGLIQLTGRDNYASFARASGVDALANPDLLLAPEGAARSAAWFWQSHGLNEMADRAAGGDGDAVFVQITRRINGGTTGLDERKACWKRTRHALGLA